MSEDIKYQYICDFLSIILEKKINSDKVSLYNIILTKTKQILEEIIDCDEYEMLDIFINYIGISEEIIVDEIYQIQNFRKSYIKFGFIEWMYKNNVELFKKYIGIIINNRLFYDLINNFNILQLFNNIIIDSQNNDFIQYKNSFINKIINIFYTSDIEKMSNVFLNLKHLELIIDICLLDEKLNKNDFSLNIIYCVLTNKLSNITILKKTIKKINLTSEQLNTYFESKGSIVINHNEENLLIELINSKSIDKIIWFLDIITDYSRFIKKTNYLLLFKRACQTNDHEISKYIYNLIQICGFEITKEEMMSILNSIIYNSRFGDSLNKDQIIFELINLGIKPPTGYPKYIEYYNNLKIYSSNNIK
jgi:hypothetical protein